MGIYSKNNLEQELSECQEQVPVWTLKFECNFGYVGYTHGEINYDNYEEYLDKIKAFEKDGCEIIK